MTSSDRLRSPHPMHALHPFEPAAGDAARAPSSYARFIPREEVGQVTAWQPGSFGAPDRRIGDRRGAAPAAAPKPAPTAAPTDEAARARELAQAVEAARQVGYRDGYRDGLVALESFKQSYAQQVSGQVGQVVTACQAQLDALQRAMADTVVHTAVALARQVVRHELACDPALVAKVAREAVDTLLESARHLTLKVHPEDASLVAAGAGETLAARGARLVADPAIERGGCLLESDIGRLDASLAARWQRAVGQLGVTTDWAEPPDDGPSAGPSDARRPATSPEPAGPAAASRGPDAPEAA
jgi:flagellar assembly protein FliH